MMIAKVLENNTKMTRLNLSEVGANDESAFCLSRLLLSNTTLKELKLSSIFLFVNPKKTDFQNQWSTISLKH